MDKFVLRQYERAKIELADIRRRADRADKQLEKLEKEFAEGTVRDVVKGGEGGWQAFHIEGIPDDAPIRAKKSYLEMQTDLLKIKIDECTNLAHQVEVFIANLDDSEIRQIIRHRFIDGATWANVAARMGSWYSEDSVRKIFERFMADENENM